jgi:amino acid transporter
MERLSVKRILFGEPFPTSRDAHERVDKIRGLAIFASDPISSNAYSTEAILTILIVLGSQAFSLALPIAMGIGILVLTVSFSYIQTILHYPHGGGSYVVSKDNLGTLPSLFAAGALLTDYVLTVAVSISAGTKAITSAFPQTFDYRVGIAITAIILLSWINLRGVRESGAVFAVPTYAFIVGVFVVIAIGLARYFGIFGAAPLPTEPIGELAAASTPVESFAFIWILLRAFAAGCTALTGIEAISDGVKAFRPPESINAAKTMFAMAAIAISLFLGISFLATHMQLIPSHADSLLSQMTRMITGGGLIYYWVQMFTMLILFLAANTGFQDFPRVSSFLANDGFMPRWMANRGDRLVFSYGIVSLALISSIIVVIFQADEIAMLPLYAIGVMVSFTLSQLGMSKLMGKIGKLQPDETLQTEATTVSHEKGWRWKQAVSTFGSVITFVVLIVLIVTKFRDGAWIVVIAVPMLVWLFSSIKGHYRKVAQSLSTRDMNLAEIPAIADIVILPIGDVHAGTLMALKYAKKISNNVRAISITTSDEMRERLERRWNRFPEITGGIHLEVLEYDYRDILTPLVDYIIRVHLEEFPGKITTVVIPEFTTSTLQESLLHNHTANFLRSRLIAYKGIVLIDVPYHID